MPYRIDLTHPGAAVLERLIDLGALDADALPGGALAVLMPDAVPPEQVARTLGVHDLRVSPAIGRDAGSVWVLRPRPVHVGRLQIVPAGSPSDRCAIQLVDSPAFGTGLHPTTALCLEALQDALETERPEGVLDVGTGSGVLALAALALGVPRAVGIDIDDEALRAAAENANINGMSRRLVLTRGGPDAVTGTWPLVLANVLAAPLIEMAPALSRRLARRGLLVLSGIPVSLEGDVDRAYVRQGLHRVRSTSRDGWVALLMRATW